MTDFPDDFPIIVLEVTEPITLYRGCHGSEMATLTEAMRSNYESGRNPHPAELRAIAVYMSVSMFERCVSQTHRASSTSSGGYASGQSVLQPGLGICRAHTSIPGHWSVWDLPHQLAECVVDVFPTRETDLQSAPSIEPVYFVILDDGNLVKTFEDENEAMLALERLAEDPAVEPHLLLIAFAADGEPVADCIPGERLVIPV